MTIRLSFAVLALALIPTFGLADCPGHSSASASSCMEGHVWDPVKAACVLQPSS